MATQHKRKQKRKREDPETAELNTLKAMGLIQ